MSVAKSILRYLLCTACEEIEVGIVNWRPLPEMRQYTPDARYVPAVWQRKFFIECDDGSYGEIFADVTVENSMVPKFAVHNASSRGA